MITPQGGINFTVNVGGNAVIVVPDNVSGGYIINPLLAADQNLMSAEDLFIDPVNPPGLVGNNTTTRLAPGGQFNLIANSQFTVQANAATGGHKFTVVYWL